MSPMGLAYIVYKTGPSTEPCGTPQLEYPEDPDVLELILTDWVRSIT